MISSDISSLIIALEKKPENLRFFPREFSFILGLRAKTICNFIITYSLVEGSRDDKIPLFERLRRVKTLSYDN